MRRGLGFHARRSPGVFNPASLFLGGTVNGAWYDPSDSTTLFTDRAGTTPCGTPGGGSVVPVGAMLDERAAGYSVFFDGTGDYLSFASDSGLALGAGQYTVELWVYLTASVNFGVFFSVTGGFQFSTNAINNVAVALQGVAFQLESTTPVTLNQWVHLAVTRDSGNTTRIFLNGSQIASAVITTNYAQGVSYANFNAGLPGAHHTGYYANLRVVKGTAVYTSAFTPPTAPLSPIIGTSLLTCGTSWTGNPAITKNGDARVDGLNPFTASPVGNHAIAANDTTARPELRARVNLLERSEEFDNAYWTKGNTTVTANAAVAPDGTTTADLIYPSVTGTFRSVYRAFSGANSISISVKASGKTWISMMDLTGSSSVAWFDVANGVIGTVTAGYTAAISSQGSGWYRCTLVANSGTFAYAQFNVVDGNGTNTGTANGTDGVLLWGADGRPTNIGTTIPAYQRIADQYTYDSTGFPRYLACNGTSSAMSTPGNVNLSGTDKATVFAGVRKLSDAALAVVAEQAQAPITPGYPSIGLWNGDPSIFGAGARWGALSGLGFTTTPTSYPSPISNVLTLASNIAAPSLSIRVNGIAAASSTASQGIGNFSNNAIFVGTRSNSTFPFNGNIYSLIVVGSAVSAGQISATEQWVAGKTGITI